MRSTEKKKNKGEQVYAVISKHKLASIKRKSSERGHDVAEMHGRGNGLNQTRLHLPRTKVNSFRY